MRRAHITFPLYRSLIALIGLVIFCLVATGVEKRNSATAQEICNSTDCDYLFLPYRNIQSGWSDPHVRLLVAMAYLQPDLTCARPEMASDMLKDIVSTREREGAAVHAFVRAEAYWQLSRVKADKKDEYRHQAADLGHVDARRELWLEALNTNIAEGGDRSTAFRQYIDAPVNVWYASTNIAFLEREAGLVHLQGELAPRDLPLGFEYLNRATRRGDTLALAYLLELSRFGIQSGTVIDQYLARLEGEVAAGASQAQYTLGRLLADGYLFPEDPERSFDLIQAAAANNYPDALAMMARRSFYRELGRNPPFSDVLSDYFLRAFQLYQPDVFLYRYNRVIPDFFRLIDEKLDQEQFGLSEEGYLSAREGIIRFLARLNEGEKAALQSSVSDFGFPDTEIKSPTDDELFQVIISDLKMASMSGSPVIQRVLATACLYRVVFDICEGFVDQYLAILTDQVSRYGTVEAAIFLGDRHFKAADTKTPLIPLDYRASFDNFLIAAMNGHAGAQAYIGRAYHEGLGVVPSASMALFWYVRSVSNISKSITQDDRKDALSAISFLLRDAGLCEVD